MGDMYFLVEVASLGLAVASAGAIGTEDSLVSGSIVSGKDVYSVVPPATHKAANQWSAGFSLRHGFSLIHQKLVQKIQKRNKSACWNSYQTIQSLLVLQPRGSLVPQNLRRNDISWKIGRDRWHGLQASMLL